MKVQIFDQNHGLTPMKKRKFFDFWKWPFYILERMVFPLKHYLEVFPGVFAIKINMHEISNFWPKSSFYILERMVFSLKHYLEVIQGVFSIKTDMHESWNFEPKSWVNPFGKIEIFWRFENDLFIV